MWIKDINNSNIDNIDKLNRYSNSQVYLLTKTNRVCISSKCRNFSTCYRIQETISSVISQYSLKYKVSWTMLIVFRLLYWNNNNNNRNHLEHKKYFIKKKNNEINKIILFLILKFESLNFSLKLVGNKYFPVWFLYCFYYYHR